MAQVVYFAALIIVFATIALTLAIDAGLFMAGGYKATITCWIRDNRVWLWVPAIALLIGIIVLVIHILS